MCNIVGIVLLMVACTANLNRSHAISEHAAGSAAVASAAAAAASFKRSGILRDSDRSLGSDEQSDVADRSSGSSSSSRDSSDSFESGESERLSLADQVRLLTKQMNALMTHRHEDFKLLENNLEKALKKNAIQFADADMRAELDKLR